MKLAVALSKIAARFHRWSAAAALLSSAPLAGMDSASRGRLSYVLMMTAHTDASRAQKFLRTVLRRNGSATPELLLELSDMAVRVLDNPTAKDLLRKSAEGASNLVTRNAATRLLALLEAQEDGTLEARIAAMVDALRLPLDGAPLTLAPVSGQYLDMWSLWLAQTRKHIVGRIVALAMNDAARVALSQEPDVSVIDAGEFFIWDDAGKLHPRTRGVLWYVRTLFLRELVRRGHTVLVLDLDAIAVGDVAPMLASLPACDVVAQKDYSIPVDVARKLGFIICCGFMQWRPNPAALALLDRFVAQAAIERDDQLALNHLLAVDGIVAKQEDERCMQFESAGVRFVLPSPALISRTLDSGSIVRHFQQQGKSVAELKAALGIS